MNFNNKRQQLIFALSSVASFRPERFPVMSLYEYLASQQLTRGEKEVSDSSHWCNNPMVVRRSGTYYTVLLKVLVPIIVFQRVPGYHSICEAENQIGKTIKTINAFLFVFTKNSLSFLQWFPLIPLISLLDLSPRYSFSSSQALSFPQKGLPNIIMLSSLSVVNPFDILFYPFRKSLYSLLSAKNFPLLTI